MSNFTKIIIVLSKEYITFVDNTFLVSGIMHVAGIIFWVCSSNVRPNKLRLHFKNVGYESYS